MHGLIAHKILSIVDNYLCIMIMMSNISVDPVIGIYILIWCILAVYNIAHNVFG